MRSRDQIRHRHRREHCSCGPEVVQGAWTRIVSASPDFQTMYVLWCPKHGLLEAAVNMSDLQARRGLRMGGYYDLPNPIATESRGAPAPDVATPRKVEKHGRGASRCGGDRPGCFGRLRGLLLGMLVLAMATCADEWPQDVAPRPLLSPTPLPAVTAPDGDATPQAVS